MEINSTNINTDTNSVKIIRGQRGNVGWEIKIVGDDINKILKQIEETDNKLIQKYKEIPIKKLEEENEHN